MIQRLSTKDLLVQSLIELCNEKSIDEITVADITENCGLGRSTFYYYFEDIFDLILYQGSEWDEKLLDDVMENGNGLKDYIIVGLDRNTLMSQTGYMDAMRTEAEFNPQFFSRFSKQKYQTFSKYLCRKMGVRELDSRMAFALKNFAGTMVRALMDRKRDDMGIPLETRAEWIVEDMPEILKPYFVK